MTSIRHFPAMHPLPDWCNFGVMLRVLVSINILAVLAALVQAPDLRTWFSHYLDLATVVEPSLLIVLGILALGRDFLRRLPLRIAQALVVLLAGGIALLLYVWWQSMVPEFSGNPWRIALLGMIAAGILLVYFELRAAAFSPALAEARLAALNARIRPHFLFNSLNAVLSLIRTQPQQAEEALESLADLFRAAMRDSSERICLSDAIALAKQYLDLEKLRLGERLILDWRIGSIPMDLPIPPLMLQPLLENAVYHGIESSDKGGTIRIEIYQRDERLIICIGNPVAENFEHHEGNNIALANIRERLALYYDLEASFNIESNKDYFEVRIALPCKKTKH